MSDHELLESEVALIRRILKGETELYYELIRPYRRMIYATAFSILPSLPSPLPVPEPTAN